LHFRRMKQTPDAAFRLQQPTRLISIRIRRFPSCCLHLNHFRRGYCFQNKITPARDYGNAVLYSTSG
jgi:hypothetical protein